MDELIFPEVFKNIILVISILGILAGLDLLSGAKVISTLKRILDLVFYIDKIIIKVLSSLKKTLDRYINFDETVIKTKARIILGVLFLLLSIFMILLVNRG